MSYRPKVQKRFVNVKPLDKVNIDLNFYLKDDGLIKAKYIDIEYIVSFFAMHLNDSSNDHVLRHIKDDKAYQRISSMIDELLSLDVKVNDSRLCTERSIDDFYGKGEEYYFDSYIMEKDDDSHYSLDFIDWREVIDSKIDEHSLFKYGYLDVATSIMWELSFLGLI